MIAADKAVSQFGKAAWYVTGLALFLVVVLWPHLANLLSVAGYVFSGEAELSDVMLSGRQLGLLVSSLVFSAVVSACCLVISTVAASAMLNWSRPPLSWLRWAVIPLVVVPPYIHSAAWSKVIGWLGAAGGGPGAVFAVRGWAAAGVVEVMAYLPVAMGLALAGMLSVNAALVQAALTHRDTQHVFRRVILPLALPSLLAGACVVFVLSLSDYSVPSLFQVQTFAMELFVSFSATRNPAAAVLLALPQLVVAAALLYIAAGFLRRVDLNSTYQGSALPDMQWPPAMRLAQNLALIILLLQAVVPVVSLLAGTESFAKLAASVSAAHSEITVSLLVAGASALLCLPAALFAAHQLGASRISAVWWAITLLPVLVPGPLTGIGLIKAWNAPVTSAVYGTEVMLVLASLARFTPFAALVLFAYLRRGDRSQLQAAQVFGTSFWRKLRLVYLPYFAPGLAAAGAVVGAFSLGELGATLLVAPPGYATLTMRIYNYMHYGSSASVSGLALTVLLAALLLCGLALWCFVRSGRGVGQGVAAR